MRLVLVGPPGSGKGTQAELLVKRFKLATVGTGAMFRDAIARGTDMGRAVGPLIKQGLLVPDPTVNDVVAELFRGPNRPERFVMDGYPRTYAQAVSFDALLRQEFLALDAVVNLSIADDEVVKRMLARGRADDMEATIRRRLGEFHKNTDDLVEHYRKQKLVDDIDATQPPDVIFEAICEALKCRRPDEFK